MHQHSTICYFCLCVELRWQLWAFNNNSIKNDAGHSAEGSAAKSQLKCIQIHPCACLSSHHENTIMFSHWILWLRITTRQIGNITTDSKPNYCRPTPKFVWFNLQPEQTDLLVTVEHERPPVDLCYHICNQMTGCGAGGLFISLTGLLCLYPHVHIQRWPLSLDCEGVGCTYGDVFLLKPIAKGFYLHVEIILPFSLLDKSSN